MKNIVTFIFVLSLGMFACTSSPETEVGSKILDLPLISYDYKLSMPESFGVGTNVPGFVINEQGDTSFVDNVFICDNVFNCGSQNPAITNKGATLGRVLFYDPQLSLNNSVACASCHKQSLAFSDDVKGSKGFGGKVTPRNSMAIVNPSFNNNLFWDSRSSSVLDLVARPIQNHIEMGMENMQELANKLQKISYYPDLFKDAYGTTEISEALITDALAQFVCSMKSSDSKFDRGVINNFTEYNASENLGRVLFFGSKAKCSQCHAGSNFAAPDFPGGSYGEPAVKGTANIGLDVIYKDQGKSEGQFRIPSLRNIALTAPYMHDGRFSNLEEVVNHYNSGIKPHNNLDSKLKDSNGSPQQLGLNEIEKRALVAFLNTLTDEVLTRDAKYSNPFK